MILKELIIFLFIILDYVLSMIDKLVCLPTASENIEVNDFYKNSFQHSKRFTLFQYYKALIFVHALQISY
jgi:hypothetical protein